MAQSKREAFRSYLDKGGVYDALNSAMTDLNDANPRPADPLAFVREKIGAPPLDTNVDALLRENQDLTARSLQLRYEIAALEGK
jgi:hypothetical protein